VLAAAASSSSPSPDANSSSNSNSPGSGGGGEEVEEEREDAARMEKAAAFLMRSQKYAMLKQQLAVAAQFEVTRRDELHWILSTSELAIESIRIGVYCELE
jgi:hypothetical protein